MAACVASHPRMGMGASPFCSASMVFCWVMLISTSLMEDSENGVRWIGLDGLGGKVAQDRCPRPGKDDGGHSYTFPGAAHVQTPEHLQALRPPPQRHLRPEHPGQPRGPDRPAPGGLGGPGEG